MVGRVTESDLVAAGLALPMSCCVRIKSGLGKDMPKCWWESWSRMVGLMRKSSIDLILPSVGGGIVCYCEQEGSRWGAGGVGAAARSVSS